MVVAKTLYPRFVSYCEYRISSFYVASCDNMLCKVDLTSTFYNKFCVYCSYYHYRGNLSRNKS